MQPKIAAIAIVGVFACVRLGFAAYADPKVLTLEDPGGGRATQHKVEQLRADYENVEIRTRTPWTKEGETVVFRGPRILDFLERHGLGSRASVQFIAYDNFTSEITLEEIRSYAPIFAIDRGCVDNDRRSGRCTQGQTFTPLTPEEQGPIFLVWPYEDLPEAYVPARNSIWVWFVVAYGATIWMRGARQSG